MWWCQIRMQANPIGNALDQSPVTCMFSVPLPDVHHLVHQHPRDLVRYPFRRYRLDVAGAEMDLFMLKIDVFAGRVRDAIEVAEDQGDGADIGVGFPTRGQKAEDGVDGIVEDGGYVDVAEETLGAYGGEVADFEEGEAGGWKTLFEDLLVVPGGFAFGIGNRGRRLGWGYGWHACL